MANDDDVIDSAVVRIGADTSGLRADVKKGMKKELAGLEFEIPVKLEEAAAQRGRNYVADLRTKYLKEQLTRTRNANEQIQRAADQARQHELKQERSFQESMDRLHRQAFDVEMARVRSNSERIAQAQERANREQLERQKKAADDRTRVMEAESKRRNKDLFTSEKFIDYGGKGVKPMNLLYGIVTAMTPALFAMGASAVQASTSIAALGSAGIGAALGLSAVGIAFQGIGDALSLRKTVLGQETTEAANSAKDAVNAADDLARSKRALADAQRDEARARADVHSARREAIRDLEDLRKAVRDLDNQYKSDTLSVAEAQQNLDATNANYFANALDRARATQDLNDAKTRLADTALERKQKKDDLRTSLSKGIEGSDKVRDAKERVRDARDRTLDAQDSLKKSTTGTIDKTSSAAAQLKKKIADMAPAAREMYYWFEKNEDLFKRLQKQIAQKVLPGFNDFLQAITAAPKGGKSTLQLAAEYAGDLGAIIGKYVGKLGEWTKSPLFRSSMARMQERNAAAFDKLGQAMLALADPIIRILDKAAPGFESLSDTILNLSTSFATWIKKLDESGALAKWFEDSRIEAKKWFDIAGNILTLLKNLFTAALPAGGSLVSSFQEFTRSLADWSGSAEGTKQINSFFDKIKNLPYADIIDFFKNAVVFFAAWRAAKFLKTLNPFFAALGAFAAANPELTARALAGIADSLVGVMEYAAQNPKAVAAVLGLVAALKLGKAVGFSLKLPAVTALQNALTSKFKFLDKFLGGSTTTGTMTVHAGVVNIYSKALTGGGVGDGGLDYDGKRKPKGTTRKPGLPGKAIPGALPMLGATPSTISTLAVGALNVAGGLVAATIAVDTILGKPGAALGGFKALAQGPQAYSDWSKENAPGFKRFFSMTLPGWITAGGDRGWSSFKDALYNDLGISPGEKKKAPPKLSSMQDEALAMSRLKNNLSSFGKDSNVTKESLNNYVKTRRKSVEDYVNYIRGTQGPLAADLEQQKQDKESRRVLSELMQQYGWTKAAADVYTRQVFNTNTQTQIAADKALAASKHFDSMGNSLDTAAAKAKGLNTEATGLKDTVKALVGSHTIALSTKGYDEVKKQLDLLYATQHVLYNPAYSNSVKHGADTISSQNQFLDPKTGLPKKYMKAAGGPIYGPGTGTSDSIPAWLSTGEYVMPAKTVQHYGMGVMENMRKRRLPAYADGGPVMPFVVNLPKKGFQFPEVTLGTGGDQEYTGRTPKGLGAVKGLSARMMAAVIATHQQFPWASVTSGLRPGAITVTGNPSNHGFGRATDWPASMQLFNYFVQQYGKTAREIIYSPAGHRQMWRGKPHMYSGKVRATHWNHVHLALADGGLVPRKYDSGGTLPPGYSLAFNGTGKNETIRTERQEQALTAATTRLDRRDLALLAQYTAQAVGNPAITMDGRRVAETTNRYNYLPAGVQ